MGYPVGVIHGRFQPFHKDHLKYVTAGMEQTDFMFVAITNPDPSLTKPDESNPERSQKNFNPCTYYERLLMIQESLFDAGYRQDRFCIVPLPINIPELYRYYVPQDAVYFLTIYDEWGEKKLKTFQDMNLKTEVLWKRNEKGIEGKEIRRRICSGEQWEEMVPPATLRIMEKFGIGERIRGLEVVKTTGVTAVEGG